MVVMLPIMVVMVVLVLIVVMVMASALAVLAMLVVVLVIVTVALLAVLMVVVLMIMVVIVASALAVLAVLVMMLMIMVVTAAGAVLPMLMVMMMLVGSAVLVDVHHDPGILESMERDVLQFMIVYIQYRCHEAELHFLAGPDLSVEENALVQISEVHGHGLVGIADGHLYVSHQCARFPLDPSADLHEHIGEPRLHIGVESAYLAVETDGFPSGHLR